MKDIDARKIGREIYDGFVASGREFTSTEVMNLMRESLTQFQEEAYESLVRDAYSHAESGCKARSENQGTLFDLDGVLILGGNRRIGQKSAQRQHYEEVLAIDDANKSAVVAANRRKHEKYQMLRPYWGAGMTMAQAVEAYNAAHPGDADIAA